MEGGCMRAVVMLLALVCVSVRANFIVKYQDGSSEIVKDDPRLSVNKASVSKAVSYIEEDRILKAHQINESDPLLSEQWVFGNYLDSSFNKAKIFQEGSKDIVVAVVDTGILYHDDFEDRIITGADFISDIDNARDGDGRDFNALDMGDYGDGNCRNFGEESSWHGTHIAGIIGAVSGNSLGVVGTNDNVKILPLRVLGPCGGKTSDIADAVRYAAGGSVEGLGENTRPAKVINLSLGGFGSCSQYMQEAIDFANKSGSVIIVSAGNEGSTIDTGNYTPANCSGVFRVGSNHPNLRQSTFSNYGESVDIYAPGDNIYSLSNRGLSEFEEDSYISLSGTSMSAGFVSAIAAGVFGLNEDLTSEQVKGLLSTGAKPITCIYGGCESGTINPYAIYLKAQNELRDEDYVYDEVSIISDVSNISTSSNIHSSDGGGCGTLFPKNTKITKDDQSNFFKSLFMIALSFLMLNTLIRKHLYIMK